MPKEAGGLDFRTKKAEAEESARGNDRQLKAGARACDQHRRGKDRETGAGWSEQSVRPMLQTAWATTATASSFSP